MSQLRPATPPSPRRSAAPDPDAELPAELYCAFCLYHLTTPAAAAAAITIADGNAVCLDHLGLANLTAFKATQGAKS
jgi:hypothetical protein